MVHRYMCPNSRVNTDYDSDNCCGLQKGIIIVIIC